MTFFPITATTIAYFQITKFINDRFMRQKAYVLSQIVGFISQTTTICLASIFRFDRIDTLENTQSSISKETLSLSDVR